MKRPVHTTIGCGKQGFPSAQPYLSHTIRMVNSLKTLNSNLLQESRSEAGGGEKGVISITSNTRGTMLTPGVRCNILKEEALALGVLRIVQVSGE